MEDTDFSVYAYLSQLSNEELKAILRFFLRGENLKEYYHAIPDIIMIMEERGML